MTEQISTTTLDLQGIAPLLSVFDMPTSLKFYRDILDFKVISLLGEGDDVGWVLLKLNDIELMLNTAYDTSMRPPSPDLSRKEGHNDIVFYFGCPDVNNTYLYLKQKGLQLKEPEITGYGWKTC